MAHSDMHEANRRLLELQQRMSGDRPAAPDPEPIYHMPRPEPPAPMSDAEVIRRFDLRTLDELTTAHMPPQQARTFDALLARVRAWRHTDRSFLLCSETKGIGKTHIARAVYDNFGLMLRAMDGEWAHYDRQGKFVTARELIAILGDKPAREWVRNDWPILVLDDIGREGNIQYVAAADQQREVRARYYDLINHCYTRGVRLFITSNYTVNQLAAGQGPFDEATFSRLLEMCGKGHMIDLQGFSDYRKVLGGF